MKLTLTKVVKQDSNKAGDAYIGKNGKPYSRASIKTQEHGETWLGGFWSDELKVGATIDAEITEREYNGKTYKDFKIARRDQSPAQNNAATAELKNILMLKIVPMLQSISERLEKLEPQPEEPENSDPQAIDDAFEEAFPE